MPSYSSSSDFLQSHYTVILSSFLQPLTCISWCCCSISCISRILVLLSHRSRISAVIQSFFLLTMFAKDLTGCFSHCCVEDGDHWIYACIFIAHDGERCKPPTYHSLEGFQQVGIFQLFEVKLESYVFWLADFFQAKAEGHHQQVRAIRKFSTGSSCSLNLSRIAAGVCLASGMAQELKRQSPISPTWRRMCAVCSASGIFFAVKYSCSLWEKSFKTFCVVVCRPVHLRCMIHVERLSVGLLTLKQELWLFFCALCL